jgi:hypothetical protein
MSFASSAPSVDSADAGKRLIGRVFEEDESGMVYAVDSHGERIVDPTFRRRRRPTNESADE